MKACIVGAGPAGLAAAEQLALSGVKVVIHERSANPARKFLLAGRGGLNLTHSEPIDAFLDRYGAARGRLEPVIRAFSPADLRDWCHGLGIETFIGSSGRVFPVTMKASPLLRAWLQRLDRLGVALTTRSRWIGFDAEGRAGFEGADGARTAEDADVYVLALGGGSWPRLGSDGSWPPAVEALGAAVLPLEPFNCGWRIAWSEAVRSRFAGAPLKPLALSVEGVRVRGEAVITAEGLEGGAVYAACAAVRAAVRRDGRADLHLDFMPDVEAGEIEARWRRTPPAASTANRLKRIGLSPPAAAVVREAGPLPTRPEAIARRIKTCRLSTQDPFPIARAISSAGGASWSSLADDLSLTTRPDVFLAGEMIDWEAPTGGYLLQACLATGRWAAAGALARVRSG